jgi:hypothetical protein
MSELQGLRDQLAAALATVDRLIAGPTCETDPLVLAMPCTQAIVWVLDHDAGVMAPKDVTRRLHELGRHDKADTVGPTMNEAARLGRITWLGHGMYCSNRHVPAAMRPSDLGPVDR